MRLAHLRARCDRGSTLVELLVGMSILGVVVAGVFSVLGGLIQDYSTTSGLATASSQSANVFLRLDKEVRYSRQINPPTNVISVADVRSRVAARTAPVDVYLELLVDQAGPDRCSQWRLVSSRQVIEQRSWLVGATPPTTWATVARGVVNAPRVASQVPFTVVNGAGGSSFQRLDLHLLVRASTNQPVAERQVAFVARNSSISDQTGPVCADASGQVPRP